MTGNAGTDGTFPGFYEGAGPGLRPHALPQNPLPQASGFSKLGHSWCLHQEIFLIRNSAFCISLLQLHLQLVIK